MKELLAKRAQLIQAQRELLDAAKGGSRALTAEEETRFNALEIDIQGVEKLIEHEKSVNARMADLDKPDGQVFRPSGDGKKLDNGGFSSFGEFVAAARWGDRQGRLAVLAADDMKMGDGSSGGFAVPEQFRDELLMVTPEEAIMRVIPGGATVIPAGDPPDAKVTMPALSQSRGIHGGVEFTWIAEGGEKAKTDAKLEEVSLEPQEAAGHIVVTDKLLRNWRAANAVLRRLLRGAKVSGEDLAFLKGNGVGKPLGVLNSPAAIVVKRHTASKVLFADIGGMLEALNPESESNALWIAHQTLRSQLMALKDEAGNSIFIRGDITKGLPATLGGIPIRWTGKTARLGSKGDLALIDRRYYLIKDGSGPFIAASEHVFFRENKTVIKLFWLVDGQPWLKAPLTLEDGVTQASPFVILQ